MSDDHGMRGGCAGIGGSLLTLARPAVWEGDLHLAEERARESLAIRAPLEDRLGVVCCLEVVAEELGRRQASVLGRRA